MLTYPIYGEPEHLEQVASQEAQMLTFDTVDRVPEHLVKSPPFRENRFQMLKMPQMSM